MSGSTQQVRFYLMPLGTERKWKVDEGASREEKQHNSLGTKLGNRGEGDAEARSRVAGLEKRL